MPDQNGRLAHAGLLNCIYEERPKLLAMAASLLADRSAAERVFNELVIAIQDRDREFASHAELYEWSWKALRNRCLNLVARGDFREVELERSVSELLDRELASRDATELAEWSETLRPCLAQLTPAARWIVQLRYFDGLPGLEVARLTGRNPVSIYGDLQRIYTVLSTCLRKRVPIGKVMEGPSTDREFQRLVFRYLDDQLTGSMAEKLATLVLQDERRIAEFNDIRLHAALLYEFASRVTPGDQDAIVFPEPTKRRTGRNWCISIGVTVVVVGGALGLLWRLDDGAGPVVSPVTFVAGADAEFVGTVPSAAGTMKAGSYNLKKGIAQLRMTSGAALNVEGPAQFDVVSENEIDLHEGTVTALVPEQAVGFVVDTPVARIRDLGTEFGVVVGSSQEVDVVVFNGRVEVERDGFPREELTTGEGLQVRTNKGAEKLEARRESYRFPMMPAVSSPQRVPGNLVLNPSFEIGPLSRSPHSGRSYRDLPSGWETGRFVKGAWQPVAPRVLGTIAGLTDGSRGAHYPSPSHGERYVYLDGADWVAFRQEVGVLEAGATYQLSVGLATLGRDSAGAAKGRFQFGLWAGGSWIAEESGTLVPGEGFKEIKEMLPIPKGHRLTGAPLLVVLSGRGTVFYDNAHLTVSRD